ncbi:MAG: glycosyltransferase family 2 protein [Cyclobacteriaceae bacterium]
MNDPLVTIICLCYNHERFIEEALESVFSQDYPSLEVIVVDDASTDESVKKINDLASKYDFTFIKNAENIGNCKSFNKAFSLAKGAYIIDFATDDILGKEQVTKQVKAFEESRSNVGIVFSNASLINEEGEFVKHHYPVNKYLKLTSRIPSGDVYSELVKRYFICPPSMMIKKEVLDELNGYDESLAYEDFDFWVKSSRKWNYYFLDVPLVKKRITRHSLSTRFENRSHSEKMYKSTLEVCQKAYLLNETKNEYKALLFRIGYEGKQALKLLHFSLFLKFVNLWVKSFWKAFF